MSIPSSLTPLFNSGSSGGLQISRSIRLNSADSAYLNRTPAVAGDRTKWTWAAWVKRSELGRAQFMFCGGPDTANDTDQIQIFFQSNDTLRINSQNSAFRETTQVFRDSSAWYHFVVAVDTTIASPANDRIKFYVNGSQVTTFNITVNPTQNANTGINATTQHTFGRSSGVQYISAAFSFSGYLANMHLVDGQQLTPSSFTETDATTGQLIPKTYTGSYGTNGFNLLFADNSSNTASTLGKDTSPNGNNFTPNNLSVTAGAGNDSLVDSPTNYGTDTYVGGQVRGNYCTWNPLQLGGATYSGTQPNALTNGNLDWVRGGTQSYGALGTFAMVSGKWYWEGTAGADFGSNSAFAIAYQGISEYQRDGQGGVSYGGMYQSNGTIRKNGTAVATYATYTTGDIIGIGYDADSRGLTFYKNGSSQGTITLDASTTPYVPWVFLYDNTTSAASANFGQRAFAYTAPSGFKALCTQNLPAPLVTKSNTAFDIRSGLSAQFTISDLNFTTGLVVGKSTNNNEYWIWADVVRSFLALRSNTTDPEGSGAAITNVSSTGYQSSNNWFTTSRVYVTYNWDAGTSTVSNTAGSITNAMVRANTTAGFSVVTYTGTGANATVGHGLGVAPGFIIIKNRSAATNWRVYHSALGNTKAIFLSTTGASDTSSVYWNNTSPTSTVFSVGSDDGANGNTNLMVAYCFTPIVGYSSFGSYTGNGSSTGPFVYTGFRPKFLLIKNSSLGVDGWSIWDAARDTYNKVIKKLEPNSSGAEGSNSVHEVNFLSNGFQILGTWDGHNGSGSTMIYAAFAEASFNYSRAR